VAPELRDIDCLWRFVGRVFESRENYGTSDATVKLYKFRSFRSLDRLLDILVMRRLYCAEFSTLNDPFGGVYMSVLYSQARNVLYTPMQGYLPTDTPQHQPVRHQRTVLAPGLPGEHFRVCSLSASMKDIRLWSTYADSHRGVAIEVDIPADRLDPVTYVTALPQHPVHLFDQHPQAKKILTTKTNHWEHEEEHRVLQTEEYFALGDASIRVFVGPRSSDADVALLERLQLPGIGIVRTRLDGDALEVRIAP
jgi:hypothetical protein